MASIKSEAKAYEAPVTHNISELNQIPVDLELKNGEGKNKDGETFKYKYIIVDGKEYRVPGTVLGGLKALLAKMPSLEYFSVTRTGEKLNTQYTVIPHIEPVEELVK